MNWDGKTEEDQKAQNTSYEDAGEAGYLRGAYFGGYSDVMRHLFDWMDWDEEAPFNAVAFEAALKELKDNGLERPDKGAWDHSKGREKDWGLSGRQNSPVDSGAVKEYEVFLAFGRKLEAEGKNPRVYISY